MKLAMELYRDDEVEQWGYSVPALSIIGTGCASRDEARRLGLEAIRYMIDAEGQEFDGEADVVMFDVDVRPAARTP